MTFEEWFNELEKFRKRFLDGELTEEEYQRMVLEHVCLTQIKN